MDPQRLYEKIERHIKEFEKASDEWDAADLVLKRRAGGDAVKLRIARRDDLDRGDAYKAVMFHLEAAEMYALAYQAEMTRRQSWHVTIPPTQ